MLPPSFIPPVFPGNFPGQEPRHQFFPHPRPGVHDGVPIGAIIIFPGELLQQTQTLTSAMTDLRYMPWMICDGSSLLRTEYPELFRVIGDLYGADGNDKFKLPDYRGYFLRGVDLKKSLDKDDRTPPPGTAVNPQGVGSTQKDALQDHKHKLNMTAMSVTPQETPPVNFEVAATDPLSHTDTIYPEGDVRVSKTETRAVNIAVNWLIKTK
ncbi:MULTISPECIES: phage tail protein [Rhizobium]|uniref:phage tail protein n=1 Tax=Rhizobium TaxID=379 RepID=UPI00195B1545|nr:MULTISPECIES: phage tail protein [Rhizobium]MBM7045955.1 tail fiber protein [Rhizobium lusitanum]